MRLKAEAKNHFAEAAELAKDPQDIKLAIGEMSLTLIDNDQGCLPQDSEVLQAIELLQQHELWIRTENAPGTMRDR